LTNTFGNEIIKTMEQSVQLNHSQNIPDNSKIVTDDNPKKPSNIHWKLISVIFILIFIILVGVFYSLRTKQTNNTNSVNTSQTGEKATPTQISSSNWKAYTWKIEELSFKYPPNWTVTTDIDQFGDQHLAIINPKKITVYDASNNRQATGNSEVLFGIYPASAFVSLHPPLDYTVKTIPMTIGNYESANIVGHGAVKNSNIVELSLSTTQIGVGKIKDPAIFHIPSKSNSKYVFAVDAGIFVKSLHGGDGFVEMKKTDFENLEDYPTMIQILKSISY